MSRIYVFIYLVCAMIGSIIGFVSQDSIPLRILFMVVGLLVGELIGALLCSLLIISLIYIFDSYL